MASSTGSRRLIRVVSDTSGPPPAALSFVNNLELVVVNNADHNGLACAICKDLLTVENMVNRLPCLHLYHPSCIKPWLSNRNTCPLCRFEVPTDDVDYENRTQSVTSGSGVQDVEQRVEDTSFEEHDVEQRVEDTSFEEREGEEVLNSDDGRGRGEERWYYMAAQVVTLVEIGLALWLGN
ncbi:zinc finger, RING/FYVE/PHD-type [Artemisia annua]|uniref:RING-type E3 ubiquitin transferase n=1 Tax=Artemisia annua TaxID=35608 RepID=A0A2U1L221_ARTAN|nr:zinc finger, RING/FYVE/PHD-type [Artemisia annua]